MKQSQKKILARLEYFNPKVEATAENLSAFGLTHLIESPVGTDYKKAFLEYTNNGKHITEVDNVKGFLNLVLALRSMTLQMKLWGEGFREGTLFLFDFVDEPEIIQELAKIAYESGKSSKFNHVKSLGFTEYSIEISRVLADLLN